MVPVESISMPLRPTRRLVPMVLLPDLCPSSALATPSTFLVLTPPRPLVGPVDANTMNVVGSKPNLVVTSTSNAGLSIGENHAFDVTITPDAKGNVQINTLVFNVTTSSTGNTLLFADDGSGNVDSRLAVGSTTITGSTCLVASKVVTCTLPSGYVLTGGTPQTLTLFVTTSGTLPINSSLTTVLASFKLVLMD